MADAPFGRNLLQSFVVEGQQCAPESRVLEAEIGLESDVEAVVEEDELCATGGETAEEDVAGVGVAVD